MSRSSKLVEALKVNGVLTPGNEDAKVEPPRKTCTMKTWSNLQNVASLEGWVLAAPPAMLDDEREAVPNVYMLIRYTYG